MKRSDPLFAPAVRAAFWMTGTLLSFMAMAVGGREMSAELNTFQILFFRSLTGLVIVAAAMGRSRWHQVASPVLGLHLLRNVVHFSGQFGWFYGIAYIPLAEVFALDFTTPVWTALLATLLLAERLSAPRVAAIALGMTGMLVILRPGLEVINPAAVAVLGGAFCYGAAHTLTKRITRFDSPLCILFYMSSMQLLLGTVPVLINWKTPAPELWPWIMLVGAGGMSGHYCMARALGLADATVVIPMDFLRLPLIAAVGMLFYAEPWEWLVLAGGTIMLAGNIINVRAEKNRASQGA